MWEPRRLTTLWVFTACYRNSVYTFAKILKEFYAWTFTRDVSGHLYRSVAVDGSEHSCISILDHEPLPQIIDHKRELILLAFEMWHFRVWQMGTNVLEKSSSCSFIVSIFFFYEISVAGSSEMPVSDFSCNNKCSVICSGIVVRVSTKTCHSSFSVCPCWLFIMPRYQRWNSVTWGDTSGKFLCTVTRRTLASTHSLPNGRGGLSVEKIFEVFGDWRHDSAPPSPEINNE
jgi:hypothetical protein